VRWLELEAERRRPVVVLTRAEAVPSLRNVVVALVTRTIRGIETEALRNLERALDQIDRAVRRSRKRMWSARRAP
jgi:mRNA-degrading endonuclease toxin of MazEF toxin-antitoxin module